MSRREEVEHRFVKHVPERLEEGVLYVSMEYATAVHSCLCDCGKEVITPLSPTDWQLGFDGFSVSLRPSIGNWSFPCESHYWIIADRVRWSPKLSRRQIEAGRSRSRQTKRRQAERADPRLDAKPERRAGAGRLRRLWRRVLDGAD